MGFCSYFLNDNSTQLPTEDSGRIISTWQLKGVMFLKLVNTLIEKILLNLWSELLQEAEFYPSFLLSAFVQE